ATGKLSRRSAPPPPWTGRRRVAMDVENVPPLGPARSRARPCPSGLARGGRRGPTSFCRKDLRTMTHTVCQPCYDCKYTDCVAVCPVECFWQDEKMLYIDPADCIDCEACVPECPVEAIFAESNVPKEWTSFTELNAERATALKESGEGH